MKKVLVAVVALLLCCGLGYYFVDTTTPTNDNVTTEVVCDSVVCGDSIVADSINVCDSLIVEGVEDAE